LRHDPDGGRDHPTEQPIAGSLPIRRLAGTSGLGKPPGPATRRPQPSPDTVARQKPGRFFLVNLIRSLDIARQVEVLSLFRRMCHELGALQGMPGV